MAVTEDVLIEFEGNKKRKMSSVDNAIDSTGALEWFLPTVVTGLMLMAASVLHMR